MHSRKPPTSPHSWYRNGKLAIGGLLPDGSHLGLGVFETIRARRAGESALMIGLALHLERLRSGSRAIGASEIDGEEISAAIGSALRSFDWSSSSDCLLRIVAYRSEWLLSASPWKPSFDPTLGTTAVSLRRERPHPELKSASALVSVLAREEAVRRGAGEALLVSPGGSVTEGAWTNLFVVGRDGELATPGEGMLPGVTRRIVVGLADRAAQRSVTLEDIFGAREAFLTQATHGIIPLVSVDGRAIGRGEPGPLTAEIRRLYESLVEPVSGARDPLVTAIEI